MATGGLQALITAVMLRAPLYSAVRETLPGGGTGRRNACAALSALQLPVEV